MPSPTQQFWKRKVIWAKVESTYGTDPTPSAALNGIEVRNVSLTPLKLKKVDQGIEQAMLGSQRELVIGTEMQLKFDVAIAGSGTAGTAPAYGPLLRACKRAEVILAAPLTGTAQAGTTTSITLAAAGSSATNDAYRNMEITATGGAGSGQSGIIKSYDGTTKIATLYEAVAVTFGVTTTYSIGAQVVYQPVDTGDESITFYAMLDRLKFVLLGCRGNVVRTLDPTKVPVFSFTFTGLWGGYSDQTALPTGTVYTAWKAPLDVSAANTTGFRLHSFSPNMYTYTVDDGNQVIHRDDMVGIEDVLITDRKATGSVVIQMPLKAEYDFYADAMGVAGAPPDEGPMTITHGTAAGNMVRFFEPAVTFSDPTPEDRNGAAALKLTLRILPVSPGGNDSIIIVK